MRAPGAAPDLSDLQQQPRRLFDQFLDSLEESDGFAPIDDAMIIRKRNVHHGTNDDDAVARNGPVFNGVQDRAHRFAADSR